MQPVIDLDELIIKAKAKRAEREALERQRTALQGASAAASEMPGTVGGQTATASIGGTPINIMAPEHVNWAAPLAKLGTAYAESKNQEKLLEAQKTEQESINSVLGSSSNDPETQRLMKLAELGVPGADKALAARMMPEKKQPIAGLLQALPNLTPEAADALATEYGMPVEQVRSMISGAQQRQQQMSEEEFKREAALRQLDLRPERPSEFEMYQQNPELYQQFQEAKGGGQKPQKFDLQGEMADALMKGDMEKFNRLKQVADAMKGRDQVDSVQYPLTPGQKADQAKRLYEIDKQISGSDQFMTDLGRATEIVDKPQNFSVSQKAAWEAANSPDTGWKGSMERIVGSATVSPDLQELNAIFLSKTLDDMAKLGGGDSNEELRTIRSAYPNAMQDQRAAKALLERLKTWEAKTREKIWQRRQDIQSGRYYSQNPEDIVTPPTAPAADTAAPPAIKIRSIR